MFIQGLVKCVLGANDEPRRRIDRYHGRSAGFAPAGDVHPRDRSETIAKYRPTPPGRQLRMFTHIEPWHSLKEPDRMFEVARAVGGPGRVRQLPDVVVAGIYFDSRILGCNEGVEIDLLRERGCVGVVKFSGIIGKRHLKPKEIVEREEARNRIAEVCDGRMAVGHSAEYIEAVVAAVIIVSAECLIVASLLLVVPFTVLD